MNKLKKKALKTGEYKDNKCYFYCSSCGNQNDLAAKRCAFCNAKRPVDAFEQAVSVLEKPADNCGVFVDRTVANAYPSPTNPCFAVPLPGNGFDSENYVKNSLINLPNYYSTDEYGRVFKTDVRYGAMPCSAPVPVPIPTKTIQVAPINLPINQQNTNN